MYYVKVMADTSNTIAQAALDAGSLSYNTYPFGDGVVGIIHIDSLSQRQIIRNNSTITLIPNANSPSALSTTATSTLTSAAPTTVDSGASPAPAAPPTAYDLHAAIFAATDLDIFDPDL